MPVPAEADLQHAAELIAQADALVVAAGAGMGVDSGLPDFRGTQGFWQAYPALGRERIAFERIANPAAFQAHPARAWGFYGHRLQLYRATVPHAGFELLRRWGERMPAGYTVFTSNVDGQFQQAGFDADRIHECHGSIHHLQCSRPCGDAIWSASGVEPQVDVAQCLLRGEPPRCPHCGALARPNILMFGDGQWLAGRSQAQARAQQRWLAGVRRPVVVELGAGTAVPSVRWFSQEVLHGHGGRLVRINPREPQVPTPLDVGLAGGALQVLRLIDDRLSAAG